jgi:hypothetical protein
MEGEHLTEDMLKAKLEFELVTKKIEKNLEELETFTDCNNWLIVVSEPVLLEEYADFLVQKQGMDVEQAYVLAQKEFTERGFTGSPVTKYELIYWDDLKKI